MFEYKEELGNSIDLEQLNDWGRQGWEYCGFIPLDPNSLPKPSWKFKFVFKRKISDSVEIKL